MSLLSNFPEIHDFFKNELFTQDQLDNLIEHIQVKYNDPVIQKAASNLIRLEVAKFEILKEKPDFLTHRNKIFSQNNHNKTKPQFPGTLPCDITNLALKLKISKRYLINLMKQKSIELTTNENIRLEDMLILKPFIQSRLKALKNHKKSSFKCGILTAHKYFLNEPHKGYEVYNKLETYGVGKVYI